MKANEVVVFNPDGVSETQRQIQDHTIVYDTTHTSEKVFKLPSLTHVWPLQIMSSGRVSNSPYTQRTLIEFTHHIPQ